VQEVGDFAIVPFCCFPNIQRLPLGGPLLKRTYAFRPVASSESQRNECQVQEVGNNG
jgi:hypothetical protein